MGITPGEIDAIRARIALGEQHIERQRRLIDYLRTNERDSSLAEEVLVILEEGQHRFRVEMLKREETK